LEDRKAGGQHYCAAAASRVSATTKDRSSAGWVSFSTFVHRLRTKAVALDETLRHRSEEDAFERRNGIKLKGAGLNSVEQNERGREQILTLLIGVLIPASQPLFPRFRGGDRSPFSILCGERATNCNDSINLIKRDLRIKALSHLTATINDDSPFP
jgi:hypothetical protein